MFSVHLSKAVLCTRASFSTQYLIHKFPRHFSRPSLQGHLLAERGFHPVWCSTCGADWACRKLTRDDFFQLWSLEPWSLQHCSSFQNAVIIWWINQGCLAGMLTWQGNSLVCVSLVYKSQGQWAAASGINSATKLQHQDLWEFCFTHERCENLLLLEDTAALCPYWGECFIVTCVVASDGMHRAFCPSSTDMCFLSVQCMLVLLFKGYLCPLLPALLPAPYPSPVSLQAF